MKKFINTINQMFAANSYTDDGRVTIDYAPNTDTIVVKVLDKIELIEAEGLTELGIMYAIMEKVREVYF